MDPGGSWTSQRSRHSPGRAGERTLTRGPPGGNEVPPRGSLQPSWRRSRALMLWEVTTWGPAGLPRQTFPEDNTVAPGTEASTVSTGFQRFFSDGAAGGAVLFHKLPVPAPSAGSPARRPTLRKLKCSGHRSVPQQRRPPFPTSHENQRAEKHCCQRRAGCVLGNSRLTSLGDWPHKTRRVLRTQAPPTQLAETHPKPSKSRTCWAPAPVGKSAAPAPPAGQLGLRRPQWGLRGCPLARLALSRWAASCAGPLAPGGH